MSRKRASLDELPLVFQIDRGAQPGAKPAAQLEALLGAGPGVGAIVSDGTHVFDTVKTIARQVLLEIERGAEK